MEVDKDLIDKVVNQTLEEVKKFVVPKLDEIHKRLRSEFHSELDEIRKSSSIAPDLNGVVKELSNILPQQSNNDHNQTLPPMPPLDQYLPQQQPQQQPQQNPLANPIMQMVMQMVQKEIMGTPQSTGMFNQNTMNELMQRMMFANIDSMLQMNKANAINVMKKTGVPEEEIQKFSTNQNYIADPIHKIAENSEKAKSKAMEENNAKS